MKIIVSACVVSLVFGGAAAAQGYGGFSGHSGHQGSSGGPGYTPPASGRDIRTPQSPKPPKPPPRTPEYAPPPRFKPFTGQHYDNASHGLDPYAKPAKPKGGFSTYDD